MNENFSKISLNERNKITKVVLEKILDTNNKVDVFLDDDVIRIASTIVRRILNIRSRVILENSEYYDDYYELLDNLITYSLNRIRNIVFNHINLR